MAVKTLKFIKKYSSDELEDNLIIKGENQSILDILEGKYAKKIKCIYIDPPYNNGDKYNHYIDNKHSKKWLNDLSLTLKKLKTFLTDDGSIWISIDDNEMHYLKVEADKIFNRKNFVNTIIWQHRTSRENRNIFSNNHEYILVYAKNIEKFKKIRNKLPGNSNLLERYKNIDNDTRGAWQSVSAHVQAGHAVKSQFYTITAPNGKIHQLPNGRCWAYNKKKMLSEIEKNNVWFGKDGHGVPRFKKFLSEMSLLVTPDTLWSSTSAGTTDLAKKQILNLFRDELVFDTPKPENLIKLILEIATNEDDIVLDAFLGSGTTTAVAHKMRRKYIGIEKEAKTVQFILNRMNQVIKGDKSGISKEVKWQGGGGFCYYSE
jgi:adenine-specific DNA-methyltransferase